MEGLNQEARFLNRTPEWKGLVTHRPQQMMEGGGQDMLSSKQGWRRSSEHEWAWLQLLGWGWFTPTTPSDWVGWNMAVSFYGDRDTETLHHGHKDQDGSPHRYCVLNHAL